MNKLNIYKRKDGRFEGRINIGHQENCKRKYKSFYGITKEEVIKKYNSFCHMITRDYSITEMTVRQMAFEWLSIINNSIKRSTYANYLMKINRHIIPRLGNIVCSDMKSKDIYRFIDRLTEMRLSARYISDIIVLIKAIFKYASREYGIKNAAEWIVMPKKTQPEIRLLDENEQKRLEKYIHNNPDNTSLGIAISLYTGLRIGELCALKWEDIDLKKRVLSVRKTIQRVQTPDNICKTSLIITEPKSEKSKRDIPIPKGLFAMLKKQQALNTYYVLTGNERPIEPRTMQYRFTKVLKNVDLPSVHFHSLRHLFATRAVALGFDIKTLSELLGHSSVELTLNRYVHSSFERKRSCMELMKWSA